MHLTLLRHGECIFDTRHLHCSQYKFDTLEAFGYSFLGASVKDLCSLSASQSQLTCPLGVSEGQIEKEKKKKKNPSLPFKN